MVLTSATTVVHFFFFFKQKTAYEMRISDWSSDVCSSDLLAHDFGGDLENGLGPLIQRLEQPVGRIEALRQIGLGLFVSTVARIRTAYPRVVAAVHQKIGRASCRERVCQYV